MEAIDSKARLKNKPDSMSPIKITGIVPLLNHRCRGIKNLLINVCEATNLPF